MSKRRPKTQGLDWLYHSLTAFNGSGYADKMTPERYLASYKAYKTWKRKPEQIAVLEQYEEEALTIAEKMCGARNAGHTPSTINQLIFRGYYDPDKSELW